MKKRLPLLILLVGLLLTGCTDDKEANNETSINSEPETSVSEEKPSSVDINPPSYF